jgi:hypothetical protein
MQTTLGMPVVEPELQGQCTGLEAELLRHLSLQPVAEPGGMGPPNITAKNILSTSASLKALPKRIYENLMNTIEALPTDQIVCCIKMEVLPLLKQLPEMKNEMLRAIS